MVGQGSVRPVPVQAIDWYPPPTTKKELMLLSKPFIGGGHMTDLLKGNASFVWSALCQGTFERVKALNSNAPVLAAPRWDRAFQLEVDASLVSAGAVLLQVDDQGVA